MGVSLYRTAVVGPRVERLAVELISIDDPARQEAAPVRQLPSHQRSSLG